MTRAVLIKAHKLDPDTVQLDEPLPEETTEIKVVARLREPSELSPLDPGDPAGWKAIDTLIGCLRSGRGDVAENHDKCLHGDSED
jgi:hypothetical protein